MRNRVRVPDTLTGGRLDPSLVCGGVLTTLLRLSGAGKSALNRQVRVRGRVPLVLSSDLDGELYEMYSAVSKAVGARKGMGCKSSSFR